MKLQNESGRSMIEMTAVLAIIGILSIASFAGYKLAMVRLRTNTLLSEASRRAVSISSQLNQGNTPNLDEFKNNTISGDMVFDTAINTNSYIGQFGLKISNVPYKICNNLLEATTQTNSPLRAIADPTVPHVALTECPKGQGENAENEGHDYLLIYNNDLASTQYQQACNKELVLTEMCNGTYEKCCPDNGNVCQDQAETVDCCETDSDCNHNEICQENNVCACPEEDHFRDKDGNCVSCSDPNTKVVNDSAECRKCPHRAWNTNKKCQLCGTGYFAYRNSTLTSSDACYSCTTTTSAYASTPESCATCTTREYIQNNEATPRMVCQLTSCGATGSYFRSKVGTCYNCNTASGTVTTQEECESCTSTEREYNSSTSYCGKKECGDNTFRKYDGTCVDCSDTTIAAASGTVNRVYYTTGNNQVDGTNCTNTCLDSNKQPTRMVVRSGGMYFCRLKSLLSTTTESGKYRVFTNKIGDKVDCASTTTSTTSNTTTRAEAEINATTTTWGICDERLIKHNGSKYYYSKLASESYFTNKDGRKVACNTTLSSTNAHLKVTAAADCDNACTATGQKRKATQSGSVWYCLPNN